MHILLTLGGLPGPGYHGGAMTCWTIAKRLKECSHRVTIVSLCDTSSANPYLDSRQEQLDYLHQLGIEVTFVDYDSRTLATAGPAPRELFTKAWRLLGKYLRYDFERMFPWTKLQSRTREVITTLAPDLIIAYHFDALSACYSIQEIPILFMAGDLWHVPPYFSQVHGTKGWLQTLLNYLDYLPYKLWSTHYLKTMLAGCHGLLTFTPQYVAWYHRHGLPRMEYFRTPIFDPVGPEVTAIKTTRQSVRPRVLLIGDLSGTSTRSGFDDFVTHVLPRLDATFGPDGFEVHILGGGTPPQELRKGLAHPAVRCLGRVVPPDDEFLAATLLLVPNSITLGIRIRIITAFSFATCVVAHTANQAGIPELADGENCLLAQNGADLAAAVLRVLTDQGLARHLAAGGRKTFEITFSEAVAAQAVVDKALSLMTRQSPAGTIRS